MVERVRRRRINRQVIRRGGSPVPGANSYLAQIGALLSIALQERALPLCACPTP